MDSTNTNSLFIFRNINELLSTAEERGAKFEAKQAAATGDGELLSDRSAKAYYKEFKKV